MSADADQMRIERLITMAERLVEALESDIAALKAGNARNLRTIDPEIQKLSALYSREAASLNPRSPGTRQPNCANACSPQRHDFAIRSRPRHACSRASAAPAKA